MIDFENMHYNFLSKKRKFHFDYKFSNTTLRILSESLRNLPEDPPEL
jgi:hypothetical protein